MYLYHIHDITICYVFLLVHSRNTLTTCQYIYCLSLARLSRQIHTRALIHANASILLRGQQTAYIASAPNVCTVKHTGQRLARCCLFRFCTRRVQRTSVSAEGWGQVLMSDDEKHRGPVTRLRTKTPLFIK